MTPITIGITTRDRPESLGRCLRSITAVLGTSHDVMIFDDISTVPVAEQLMGCDFGLKLSILRDDRLAGYIAGRNQMMQQAATDRVLLLDDDTMLLDADALIQAIAVLEADATVAAVAFAQAEKDGRPWHEGMQPGRGRVPSYVASFIGFAHLLRRSVFLSLGGYRTNFVFYGEEKDYCVRLLAAGYHVVYLPDARIAHVPDTAGRDSRRYVRHVIRNDCLASLYNDPWPLAAVGLPVRFWRFRRMASAIPGGDPGGLGWVISGLWSARSDVYRDRRAISWSTVREWRRRSRTTVPYRPSFAECSSDPGS